MKAKSIMIQGTASSVGKSLITAGICRILKQDGYRVCPFKSQNMALNSFITEEGDEMGRAQVVQAEAAGLKPDVRMNPILLKPTTEKKAQVVVNGKPYKNMTATEYHEYKPELKEMIRKTYNELASENDCIVIEGAGSPAEINLKDKDIVNMGMAEISKSPVVLVGDIDRGGVFASLAGTMLLLPEEEKNRVKGIIINKFRGDVEILKPGIKMIEEIIKVPVLGVIPYEKLYIDDEDSVTEKFSTKNVKQNVEIDIVVIKLPHISNFTDFNVFERIQGVGLRYVDDAYSIGDPDLIIIPGSKNTIEDLQYIRKSGIENEILKLHEEGKPVFGICGGYQILGKKIFDPYEVESSNKEIDGMGLLDATTVMEKEKKTVQVKGIGLKMGGILENIESVEVEGYEIHMGQSTCSDECYPFINITKSGNKDVEEVGGVTNNNKDVFGTYIHGVFDNLDFTINIVNNLRIKKGLPVLENEEASIYSIKEKEYDKLADTIRNNIDLDKLFEIINTWREED